MPSHNAIGQPRCTRDQGVRKAGPKNNRGKPIDVGYPNIPPDGNASLRLLDDLADAPIIPLAALLLSDASHEQIVRRLRLNVVIRMLLDAIAEREVAPW